MIAVRDRLRRWSLRDGRAARPPEGARNAQSGAGAGTTAQARSFEWLLASIPAPRACRREGLERQRSLAQGHSPRGNGGDLIAREQHRSTDQGHDPQSPRWQSHDEPNANHDGDKPAKQDPIDSLTNDSTSRGRFELRVRCRAAHHAVAAAATSFGLAMSPWSAAGRPTVPPPILWPARLCRAYRRLAVPGDDQQRLAFGRSIPWRRQWTQPAVTASPTSTTATPASRAERQIWRGVASLIGAYGSVTAAPRRAPAAGMADDVFAAK